jgi:S1-C subfamily serine protease
MSDWKALSDGLAAGVAAARPSLVGVRAGRRPGTGTVWSADGLVVTAAHALFRARGVEVIGPDGKARGAELVGYDPGTDLAVLRTAADGLAPPAWDDGADLQVGHLVLTLGAPGGPVRATLGIVEALGGGWRTVSGAEIDRFIEIDGRLPFGFSGGLLVDAGGRALGVNTAALVRGGTTVPTPTVRRVVEALVTEGRVRRGHLGLSVQPVAIPPAQAGAAGQDAGLLLTWVEPGGPGEKAGLLIGDVLLTVGGAPLRGYQDLLAARDRHAGHAAAVRVLRGGEVREITLEVGEGAEKAGGCCG